MAAQAASGLGYALVAVPIFALVVNTRTAVMATTALGLILTAGPGYRERGHVQVATATRMFSASLIGMSIGLVMLATLDTRLLSLIIAVSVLILVFVLWREVRLPRCRRSSVARISLR